MLKKYLEAGQVVGTHGVRGDLRVKPWCDSAAFLARFRTLYLDAGQTPVRVRAAHVVKNMLVLRLDGVDSVERADLLRGRVLYFDRADAHLPPGRYFMDDLIGLGVYDADTFVYYGRLTEILRTGANDVYRVTSMDHKNYLLPAVPEMVRQIDLKKGRILVRPIKGIFDDED